MSAAVKADPALIGGVQLALDALAESAEPGSVGDHLGATMVAERLALHSFACTASAYPGWVWTVSLARAPRSKTVTVCETALLPGADALQAPAWLPYADRLAPGDVGPGDVTPYVEDDPLLVAGFEATGDEDVDATALWELGLGRARVLSSQGRAEAAQRWYDGDHGPGAAVAVKEPAPCASCGFFVPIAGALPIQCESSPAAPMFRLTARTSKSLMPCNDSRGSRRDDTSCCWFRMDSIFLRGIATLVRLSRFTSIKPSTRRNVAAL